MSPFDYLNAIMQNKKQLIVDEETEREYSPFMVNRGLSYHKDCIMYANEMNTKHYLDKKLQNDFLLHTIRSQKRPFAKWAKNEKNNDIESIKRDLEAKKEMLIESKQAEKNFMGYSEIITIGNKKFVTK